MTKMNVKKLVSAVGVLLVASAVWAVADDRDDATKNNSAEMNAGSPVTMSTDGDVRVLFIGNSITLHGPAPRLGWNGNWGMAASAPEKDFVHLVTQGIERKTGRKAAVKVYNAAAFERNFRTFPLEQFDDLVAFRPEYLVVALGENVPTLKSDVDRLDYQKAFAKLLRRFACDDRMKPKAVVRGVFWTNTDKDFEMEHAAKDLSMSFVSVGDLGQDASMKAPGFKHKGVANHPGDKGMRAIADRVLKGLFPAK